MTTKLDLKRAFIWWLAILTWAISLPAQVRLESRVTGPEGTPIAGAMVAVVPEDSNPALFSIPLTRTDAFGRFVLTLSPGKAGLTATAAGYLPYSAKLDLKEGQPFPSLELRLKPGGFRVRGEVSDSQGRVPAQARLAFSKIPEGDLYFADVQRGSVEITLGEGAYYVLAEAEGLSPRLAPLEVKGPAEMEPLVLEPKPVPAGPEVRKWIKDRAVRLRTVDAGSGSSDLAPLKEVLAKASVVALGEATHGTSEFFRLKHRLLEFLVEEAGFSVFAVEASLPDAFAVNDYVLKGAGDPARALAGLGYWTCDFREALDMIKWMRRYNRDPLHRRKIKFYGFDMNTPLTAYGQAKDWLERRDPEGAKLLDFDGGALLSPDKAAGLKAAAARLASRLDDSPSPVRNGADDAVLLERHRQNLRLLGQWADKLRDPFGGVNVRDEAMAANVRWIQAREQGAKLVLWAHNSHVCFGPGSLGGFEPMGRHLRRALGDGYLAVALTFGAGGFLAVDYGSGRQGQGLAPFSVAPNPLGTMDGALASAGLDFLVLDLKRLPKEGPVRSWFDEPQGTWHIGSGFSLPDQDRFVDSLPVAAGFDMIFFASRTTAGHPNPVPPRAAAGGSESAGLLAEPPLPDYVTLASKNLGFEEGKEGDPPPGWHILMAKSYDSQCLPDNPREGRLCLRVSFNGKAGGAGQMNLMQSVDARPYRGKKIRWTGWIRSDGGSGNRGRLFVRADLDLQTLRYGLFDTMKDRPVTSAAWTKAVIEGVVDSDAKVLNFGCIAEGTGTVWFDGMSLEANEGGDEPDPPGRCL